MHTLYFVKTKIKEDARRRAFNILEENNFASDSNGYWGSSKGDWFVIGGRWSGLMTQKSDAYKKAQKLIKPLLEENFKENNEKIENLLTYLNINEHVVSSELKNKIDKIFIKETGLPYFRNTYDHFGYTDDVFEITKENLAILKKDYADCEVAEIEDEGDWVETEYPVEKLTEEDIGSYLVIVDYHI